MAYSTQYIEWEKKVVKEKGGGEIKMEGWEGRLKEERKERKRGDGEVLPSSVTSPLLSSPVMGQHFFVNSHMNIQNILMDVLLRKLR